MTKKDDLENLGVGEDAGTKTIQKAFRREAKLRHPDRNAGSEEAAEDFRGLKESYDNALKARRWGKTAPRSSPGKFLAVAAAVVVVLAGGYTAQRMRAPVEASPESGAVSAAAEPAGEPEMYRSSWISFRLPRGWVCKNDECHPGKETRAPENFLVVATEPVGEGDPLESLREELRNPKPFTTTDGQTVTPVPLYVKDVDIHGLHRRTWVKGLAKESARPGYYTATLATVKNGRRVSLAISVRLDELDLFHDEMEKVFESVDR
jgi:hypothetical protein